MLYKTTYFFSTTFGTSTGAIIVDVWNGINSGKILKVNCVEVSNDVSAVITGTVTNFDIYRTSSSGTGGTTILLSTLDSADSIPANITARRLPTGGSASSGGIIAGGCLSLDEGQTYFDTHILWNYGNNENKQLTIRPGEGFMVVQGNLAFTTGSAIIYLEFTLE